MTTLRKNSVRSSKAVNETNAPSTTSLGLQDVPLNRVEYPKGGKRDDGGRDVAFHLLCPSALIEWAHTAKVGELHYGPRNWEKGIPTENYIDHAMEHIVQAMRAALSPDDRIESLAHALWNIAAAIHNETGCVHHVWED
jgi:hypothetical protein